MTFGGSWLPLIIIHKIVYYISLLTISSMLAFPGGDTTECLASASVAITM